MIVKPRKIKRPRPPRGCRAIGKKNYVLLCLSTHQYCYVTALLWKYIVLIWSHFRTSKFIIQNKFCPKLENSFQMKAAGSNKINIVIYIVPSFSRTTSPRRRRQYDTRTYTFHRSNTCRNTPEYETRHDCAIHNIYIDKLKCDGTQNTKYTYNIK